MRILRAHKCFRFAATLAAACYFLVGMALSFQHTDCMARDAEILLRLSVSPSAVVRLPGDTRLAASHTSAHKPHTCAACEWQTNNLSPALSTFTFFFTPLSHLRVITTFPRYLPTRLVSTSSRAPPLA